MEDGRAADARVEAVRRRIDHWRRVRERHSPMPERLWTAAVSLAAEHGIYPIARALGLNYQTLKARLGRIARVERQAVVRPIEFVEFDGAELVGSVKARGSVVELSGTDGAKLVIRLEGRDGLDVLGLAEAFWRRR
jgi:hypothetical protein